MPLSVFLPWTAQMLLLLDTDVAQPLLPALLVACKSLPFDTPVLSFVLTWARTRHLHRSVGRAAGCQTQPRHKGMHLSLVEKPVASLWHGNSSSQPLRPQTGMPIELPAPIGVGCLRCCATEWTTLLVSFMQCQTV